MPSPAPPPGGPSVLRKEQMHASDGASLIARAHALNHFIDMQATAAAAAARTPASPRAAAPGAPAAEGAPGCLCFGGGGGGGGGGGRGRGGGGESGRVPGGGPRRGNLGGVGEARRAAERRGAGGGARAYFPDNLAAQPERHEWAPAMEWVIVGCVDFLEVHGLDEPNLFAVSAVDDKVRNLQLPPGQPLPPTTDPHVASGAIKARVRHADAPLVSKACLRRYIEATAGGEGVGAVPAADGFAATHLAAAVALLREEAGARRVYVFARVMRLLGRVSANVERSRMNAHCLAKCVAPSMLHWDPNSTFALLMLGKITGFVMAMIEEARVHDQALCEVIEEMEAAAEPVGAAAAAGGKADA